jgi:transcriptional/translational regulatory protein YebC/TACO1
MSLDRYSYDQAEREAILRKAIHTFRSAVDTDPGNEDAKVNLELALRDAKATNLPGTDPSGGAAEGTISGQGTSGSGY